MEESKEIYEWQMKKYFEGMSNFRDGRKDRVNSLEEGRVKGEIMREVGDIMKKEM